MFAWWLLLPGAVSLFCCALNVFQLWATRSNRRPRESVVRSSSTIYIYSHIFLPVVCLLFAASCAIYSLGQVGLINAVWWGVHTAGNYGLETWMVLVALQVLQAAYDSAQQTTACWIRPLLFLAWAPWMPIVCVSTYFGLTSGLGRWYILQHSSQVLVLGGCLLVLTISYFKLRVTLRRQDEDTSKFRSEKETFETKVNSFVRLMRFLMVACALGLAFSGLPAFTWATASWNAPFLQTELSLYRLIGDSVLLTVSVLLCTTLTWYFWVKSTIDLEPALVRHIRTSLVQRTSSFRSSASRKIGGDLNGDRRSGHLSIVIPREKGRSSLAITPMHGFGDLPCNSAWTIQGRSRTEELLSPDAPSRYQLSRHVSDNTMLSRPQSPFQSILRFSPRGSGMDGRSSGVDGRRVSCMSGVDGSRRMLSRPASANASRCAPTLSAGNSARTSRAPSTSLGSVLSLTGITYPSFAPTGNHRTPTPRHGAESSVDDTGMGRRSPHSAINEIKQDIVLEAIADVDPATVGGSVATRVACVSVTSPPTTGTHRIVNSMEEESSFALSVNRESVDDFASVSRQMQTPERAFRRVRVKSSGSTLDLGDASDASDYLNPALDCRERKATPFRRPHRSAEDTADDEEDDSTGNSDGASDAGAGAGDAVTHDGDVRHVHGDGGDVIHVHGDGGDVTHGHGDVTHGDGDVTHGHGHGDGDGDV